MFLKATCKYLIGPKICGSLKNKVQVFESRWNVFASISFFFQAPQYWCGEHYNIIFLVNWVCFHNKNHPQPLKNRGYFWGTFSSPNHMTQIVFKS
jgi:hypothetical protein